MGWKNVVGLPMARFNYPVTSALDQLYYDMYFNWDVYSFQRWWNDYPKTLKAFSSCDARYLAYNNDAWYDMLNIIHHVKHPRFSI